MNHTHRLTRRVGPAMGLLTLATVGSGAAGCAGTTAQVQTPRYTLAHPDYWKVKKRATADGEPTIVMATQYGDAVIDDGVGAMEAKETNYDAVTADVEIRVYAWGDPGTTEDPTQEVARLLRRDEDLKLSRHHLIAEHPPECDVLPKKYKVFGETQAPLDLVSRPGWRTIIVGGRSRGVLVGTVSRVDYQQDMGRFCHNLSNMRVQLQNALDGITPVPGGVGGASPAGGVAAGPAGSAPAATVGGGEQTPEAGGQPPAAPVGPAPGPGSGVTP